MGQLQSFIDAVKNNDISAVKEFLEGNIDQGENFNHAIRIASKNGYKEIVRLLLADPRVNPKTNRDYPVLSASENGHLEVVRLLLADERVNPSADNNCAIVMASWKGHIEVVRLLLTDSRVDPSTGHNYAIAKATENGHTKVVRLLETDQEKYPTFEIRRHNLPLDQKINKIKSEMEKVYLINQKTTNPLIKQALSIVYSNLELQMSSLEKLKMKHI